MIPISKAVTIVDRESRALGTESVILTRSVGRVLGESIKADSDMPPFDRSQMDGYAMRANDSISAPVDLKLVGESAAGKGWHQKISRGEAVRIMTGAPVPAGADAVQKVELTKESGDIVRILEATAKGRYIVRKGAEIKKGTRLFERGEIVTEKMVASLGAFGYSHVDVSTRPAVSILATGSEIVPIDRKPGRDQIRNSNSVMLKALSEQAGATVKILPSSGDNLDTLVRTIGRAAGSVSRTEILIVTGGVSVGKYDLTKAALRELNAEIYFERLRLKPGKPTVFGRIGRTLVFGLPGNPVSAAVTFYLLVRRSILRMQRAASTELVRGHAVLTGPAKAAKERDTYLPATVATDGSGRLLATPLRWLGSSDFVGFAKADVLIFAQRGKTLDAGQVAPLLFL